MSLAFALRLITQPLLQIFFAVRLRRPGCRPWQTPGRPASSPSLGRAGHALIGGIEEQVAHVHGFEDDAVFGI